MKHLDGAQLIQLEHVISARLRELRADIRSELLQSDQHRPDNPAESVHDSGDESVSNLIADLDAVAVDRDVRELRELEAARARLRTESYGLCADCGEAISWGRLLAQPAASRCITCADRYERLHAHASAPKL